MSARRKITNALIEKIKEINGSSGFNSNLYNSVSSKLKFWNEVNSFPAVHVNPGPETREYLPGGFKWAYLTMIVRIYVRSEEPEVDLENIIEDIEKVIDQNGNLIYDLSTNRKIEDIKILSINTDEGLLAPIGVGDITLHIMYDLDSST